jgi:hypothetical protein
VDIHFRSRHGVDPYFYLPMSGSPHGWQRVWFFFRNDVDAPLPVFKGSRPVPQPNWGYGVARRDLSRLQPLREIIQQLMHGGLTGADLLRTLFSHRVQPIRQWVTTMWMYPRPSCPDRPFSEELGDVEINTKIHSALAPGDDLNPGVSPPP